MARADAIMVASRTQGRYARTRNSPPRGMREDLDLASRAISPVHTSRSRPELNRDRVPVGDLVCVR
jgi:hypothetical protein